MKRVLRGLTIALGIFFLCAGVVGIFVPVLQGFLFLAIGVYLLSISSERFNAWLDRKLARFPRFHEKYARYRAKIDRIWRSGGKG